MKRHGRSLIFLGVLACGTDGSETEKNAASVAPRGGMPASGGPTVVPATATVPTQPGAGTPVSVVTSAAHGPYLTTADGRALYLLEEDPRGTSTCYEMCAAIWPPLLAGQGPPVASDSAVRGNLLGTIERRGGASQVSYNGQPLYLYLGDAGPGQGQTRGNHVEDSWGEWYLVSPTGEHVQGERRRRGEDRRGSGRR